MYAFLAARAVGPEEWADFVSPPVYGFLEEWEPNRRACKLHKEMRFRLLDHFDADEFWALLGEKIESPRTRLALKLSQVFPDISVVAFDIEDKTRRRPPTPQEYLDVISSCQRAVADVLRVDDPVCMATYNAGNAVSGYLKMHLYFPGVAFHHGPCAQALFAALKARAGPIGAFFDAGPFCNSVGKLRLPHMSPAVDGPSYIPNHHVVLGAFCRGAVRLPDAPLHLCDLRPGEGVVLPAGPPPPVPTPRVEQGRDPELYEYVREWLLDLALQHPGRIPWDFTDAVVKPTCLVPKDKRPWCAACAKCHSSAQVFLTVSARHVRVQQRCHARPHKIGEPPHWWLPLPSCIIYEFSPPVFELGATRESADAWVDRGHDIFSYAAGPSRSTLPPPPPPPS